MLWTVSVFGMIPMPTDQLILVGVWSLHNAVAQRQNAVIAMGFGSLGIAVKAPNILCHQCAKAL
jgi:hypothetical protein